MKVCTPYVQVKTFEYLVIALLLVLALISLLIGIFAISVVQGFGQYPIFKSKFAFTIRHPEDAEYPGSVLFPFLEVGTVDGDEEHSNTTKVANTPGNWTADGDGPSNRTKRHTQHLGIGRRKPAVDARSVGKNAESKYSKQDITFLTTMMVDLVHSRWGPLSLRNFIIFYPFVMEIVAIISAALLITFRTGKEHYWGLAQPWMIVVPLITIFAIMSMLTIAYCIVSGTVWKDLCTNIRSQLIDKTLDCQVVILALQPIRPDVFAMDINLYTFVFRYGDELSLSLWICCFIIMTLRCIFAVDFQLVYVTVSLLPAPEGEGKMESKQIKKEQLEEEKVGKGNNRNNEKIQEEKPKQGTLNEDIKPMNVPIDKSDQEIKMFSKERESDEDFHSAHSTLLTFAINEEEHPSLEPLLKTESV